MIQQSLEQLALAHLDHQRLAELAAMAEARPLGQYAIGIDWLRKDHRLMLPEKARYCVAIFEWRESVRFGPRKPAPLSWHRVRRISGPLRLEQIQSDVERHSRRLGHPIITDI